MKFLLSLLPLLLLQFPWTVPLVVGYTMLSRLKDKETRKRVWTTLFQGLGDGRINREEWATLGDDLGLFQRRG